MSIRSIAADMFTQIQETPYQQWATPSLSFLSLYKPLSRSMAITSGSIQTILSIGQLVKSIQDALPKGKQTQSIQEDNESVQESNVSKENENNLKVQKIAWNFSTTCFSTICVAGTLFAGPTAMLLTSGQDIFLEIQKLTKHLYDGENPKALESCAILMNHILYSFMLLGGGSQVAVAYFATQAITAVSKAISELYEDNNTAACGHVLMAFTSMYQFCSHARTLYRETNVPMQPALEAPDIVPQKV